MAERLITPFAWYDLQPPQDASKRRPDDATPPIHDQLIVAQVGSRSRLPGKHMGSRISGATQDMARRLASQIAPRLQPSRRENEAVTMVDILLGNLNRIVLTDPSATDDVLAFARLQRGGRRAPGLVYRQFGVKTDHDLAAADTPGPEGEWARRVLGSCAALLHADLTREHLSPDTLVTMVNHGEADTRTGFFFARAGLEPTGEKTWVEGGDVAAHLGTIVGTLLGEYPFLRTKTTSSTGGGHAQAPEEPHAPAVIDWNTTTRFSPY